MKKKLPLKTQIIIGTTLPIIVFIILSIYSHVSLKKIGNIPLKMYKHPFAVSNAVRNIDSEMAKIQSNLMQITLIKNNLLSSSRNHELINDSIEKVNKQFQLINDRFLGNKEKIREAEKYFQMWKDDIKDFIKSIHTLSNQEVQLKLEEGLKSQRNVYSKIDYLLSFADNKGRELNEAAVIGINDISFNSFVSIFIASLLSFFIIGVILRNIIKKLNKIAHSLEMTESKVKNMSQSSRSSGQSIVNSVNKELSILDGSKEVVLNISSLTNESSNLANETANLSKKSKKAADKGKISAQKMANSIKEIEEGFNDFVSQFKRVDTNLETINDFTVVRFAG